MTRRQALTAATTVIAGYLGQRTTNSPLTFPMAQPTALAFDFNTHASYIFKQGDRTVTLTPKELMDALAHEHTFDPDAPVMFKLHGKQFDACLGCGELVRKR